MHLRVNLIMHTQDTIAAVATPPGRGGVGIVRVSGPLALKAAEVIGKLSPQARHAHYTSFFDLNDELIDEGLLIYFPNPHSFTGEDVVEFQGHGGPIILDRLLENLFKLDIRMAEPGEFSHRAFLNNKLDLAQAEAIADLIAASSRQAAANALQSLRGEFSKQIHALVSELIQLRMYVEAAIDFPEEEIDFISDAKVSEQANKILHSLSTVLAQAKQGNLINDGMKVVLAGRPNAGKSSLMNALAGFDKALVTDIPGTTRDLLTEQIHLDGMPLHLIDTAGLRETEDKVEQLGVARAWEEIHKADRILLLVDAQTTPSLDPFEIWPEFVNQIQNPERITLVRNKVDLTGEVTGFFQEQNATPVLRLAAAKSLGLAELKQHLKQVMGLENTLEGGFSARRRHLQALEVAYEFVAQGCLQLSELGAGELLAQDLRSAQDSLSSITGAFTPDDLLGKIFSEFCIGK